MTTQQGGGTLPADLNLVLIRQYNSNVHFYRYRKFYLSMDDSGFS